MDPKAVEEAPGWCTSSFGGPANTSPADLSELEAHLQRCDCSRDRLFNVRTAIEAIDQFIAARLVTTLVLGSALITGVVAAFTFL